MRFNSFVLGAGMSRKTVLKRVAVVVSGVYLFTNVAFAHSPQTSVWKDRKSPTQVASAAGMPGFNPPFKNNLSAIPAVRSAFSSSTAPLLKKKQNTELVATLPDSFFAHVNIKEAHTANSHGAPSVVLLEDVHQNREAQQHISKAILSFGPPQKDDKVLVALEGAAGPFVFDEFRALSPSAVSTVANSFLNTLDISGPAHAGYASATHASTNMVFWGVDDRTAYAQNVRAYQLSTKNKEDVLRTLHTSKRVLDEKKNSIFSPELLAFDRTVEQYRAGTLPLRQYVSALAQSSLSTSLAFETFQQALEMESKIDFAVVEAERRSVIEKLVRSLQEKDLNQLIALSLGYQEGTLTFGDYYSELRRICQNAGVDLMQTPQFNNYIRYVLLADGVDANQLFRELASLETQVYAQLADNKEEEDLIATSRQLYLTHELVQFGLTPDQWMEYQAIAHNGDLESFENFYHAADIRSHTIVKETLAKAKEINASTVVLVAGGFHTEELAQRLKKQNVSYLVATPKITKVDVLSGSSYLSVFDREKTPLDEIFSGSKLFVVPPVAGAATPLGASGATAGGTLAFMATILDHVQKNGGDQVGAVRLMTNLDQALTNVTFDQKKETVHASALTREEKKVLLVYSALSGNALGFWARFLWKQINVREFPEGSFRLTMYVQRFSWPSISFVQVRAAVAVFVATMAGALAQSSSSGAKGPSFWNFAWSAGVHILTILVFLAVIGAASIVWVFLVGIFSAKKNKQAKTPILQVNPASSSRPIKVYDAMDALLKDLGLTKAPGAQAKRTSDGRWATIEALNAQGERVLVRVERNSSTGVLLAGTVRTKKIIVKPQVTSEQDDDWDRPILGGEGGFVTLGTMATVALAGTFGLSGAASSQSVLWIMGIVLLSSLVFILRAFPAPRGIKRGLATEYLNSDRDSEVVSAFKGALRQAGHPQDFLAVHDHDGDTKKMFVVLANGKTAWVKGKWNKELGSVTDLTYLNGRRLPKPRQKKNKQAGGSPQAGSVELTPQAAAHFSGVTMPSVQAFIFASVETARLEVARVKRMRTLLADTEVNKHFVGNTAANLTKRLDFRYVSEHGWILTQLQAIKDNPAKSETQVRDLNNHYSGEDGLDAHGRVLGFHGSLWMFWLTAFAALGLSSPATAQTMTSNSVSGSDLVMVLLAIVSVILVGGLKATPDNILVADRVAAARVAMAALKDSYEKIPDSVINPQFSKNGKYVYAFIPSGESYRIVVGEVNAQGNIVNVRFRRESIQPLSRGVSASEQEIREKLLDLLIEAGEPQQSLNVVMADGRAKAWITTMDYKIREVVADWDSDTRSMTNLRFVNAKTVGAQAGGFADVGVLAGAAVLGLSTVAGVGQNFSDPYFYLFVMVSAIYIFVSNKVSPTTAEAKKFALRRDISIFTVAIFLVSIGALHLVQMFWTTMALIAILVIIPVAGFLRFVINEFTGHGNVEDEQQDSEVSASDNIDELLAQFEQVARGWEINSADNNKALLANLGRIEAELEYMLVGGWTEAQRIKYLTAIQFVPNWPSIITNGVTMPLVEVQRVKAIQEFVNDADVNKHFQGKTQENLQTWLHPLYMEDHDWILEKLKAIKANDASSAAAIKDINNSFFQWQLPGTAGIRGTRGIGPNRINKFTVGRFTLAKAKFLGTRAFDAWTKSFDADYKAKGDRAAVIARDPRIGADEIQMRAALLYLAEAGLKKVYVYAEPTSTPQLSHAVQALNSMFPNLEGQIVTADVVTASHNPKEDVGIKPYEIHGSQVTGVHARGLLKANASITPEDMQASTYDGIPLFGTLDQLKTAYSRALENGDIVVIGGEEDIAIDDAFIDSQIQESFAANDDGTFDRDVIGLEKFVFYISPLNGVGRRAMELFLKKRGVRENQVVWVQDAPDGTFKDVPSGMPNPELKKTREVLMEKAITDAKEHWNKEGKTVVCLWMDPDADRPALAVVHTGDYPGVSRELNNISDFEVFNGNQQLALLADYIVTQLERYQELHKLVRGRKLQGAALTAVETEMASINRLMARSKGSLFAASTVVSGFLLKEIYRRGDIEVFETLVGYKYIGELIEAFVQKALKVSGVSKRDYLRMSKRERLDLIVETESKWNVGSGEESLGSSTGDTTHDKNAITGLMWFIEIAGYWHNHGVLLDNRMVEIYKRIGYLSELDPMLGFAQKYTDENGNEKTFSEAEANGIIGKGKNVQNPEASMLGRLRARVRKGVPNAITEIGGKKIAAILDYQAQEARDIDGNVLFSAKSGHKGFFPGVAKGVSTFVHSLADMSDKKSVRKFTLPKENFVRLVLEDGSEITVRPSGTEPKVKIYIQGRGTYEDRAAVDHWTRVVVPAWFRGFALDVVRVRFPTAFPPAALKANLDAGVIKEKRYLDIIEKLLKMKQGHLFQNWPAPGTQDDEKRAMLDQAISLDAYYHGGLEAYVAKVRKLAEEGKTKFNPLLGKNLKKPHSESVDGPSDERFADLEARGLKEANKLAWVLPAGGKGERLGLKDGIKPAVPLDLATGRPFLQEFIQTILATQKKSNRINNEEIPASLFIMASPDNQDMMLSLLKNSAVNQGMKVVLLTGDSYQDQTVVVRGDGKLGTVVVASQGKVPSVKDVNGNLFLEPNNPFKIASDPHGHVDVHTLVRLAGLDKQWKAEGRQNVIFFQDTNVGLRTSVLAGLGAIVKNGWLFNFTTFTRKPKENYGLITSIFDGEKLVATANIEYLVADSILPGGDVADASGNSAFPGNTNQFILDLDTYQQALANSDSLPELVGYAKLLDGKRTRVEGQMQDIAWLFPAEKVGTTQINEREVLFAPAKNSPATAKENQSKNKPAEGMQTAEASYYANMRRLFASIGVTFGSRKEKAYRGVKVQKGALLSLDPAFALTGAELKQKVTGDVKISDASSLVIEGENVQINGLDLNGALVVKAAPGVHITLENVRIENSGWALEELTDEEMNSAEVPEYQKIRGYKLVQHETQEINITVPGRYVVRGNGEITKLSNPQSGFIDWAYAAGFAAIGLLLPLLAPANTASAHEMSRVASSVSSAANGFSAWWILALGAAAFLSVLKMSSNKLMQVQDQESLEAEIAFLAKNVNQYEHHDRGDLVEALVRTAPKGSVFNSSPSVLDDLVYSGRPIFHSKNETVRVRALALAVSYLRQVKAKKADDFPTIYNQSMQGRSERRFADVIQIGQVVRPNDTSTIDADLANLRHAILRAKENNKNGIEHDVVAVVHPDLNVDVQMEVEGLLRGLPQHGGMIVLTNSEQNEVFSYSTLLRRALKVHSNDLGVVRDLVADNVDGILFRTFDRRPGQFFAEGRLAAVWVLIQHLTHVGWAITPIEDALKGDLAAKIAA